MGLSKGGESEGQWARCQGSRAMSGVRLAGNALAAAVRSQGAFIPAAFRKTGAMAAPRGRFNATGVNKGSRMRMLDEDEVPQYCSSIGHTVQKMDSGGILHAQARYACECTHHIHIPEYHPVPASLL